MSKCEDYPCCGHEDGDCPNRDGSFNCSQCGRKLSIKATSSICFKCQRKNRIAFYGGDDDYERDE